MLNALLSMLRRYDMVQPGDTVTCAVSGGADSIALLFALYLLREKLQIDLRAAHFNHNLRGEESQRDEAFVRDFCAGYSIPLTVGQGNVSAGKKGLEAAARDVRYAFLESLPGKIATAHTADDNSETVLMRLVRGTGLKGLGGIAPTRGRLIRPMLLTTRQQVMDFIREYSLPFVEDSSNATDAFLRNRLRRKVMPLLKEENPKLAENLSAMALRLREDEAALTDAWDFSQGLSVEAVKSAPTAKQSRMLAAFLEYCGVKEPAADHIDLALSLIDSQNPSARAHFPGSITVSRQYDRLVVIQDTQPLETIVLNCPGVTEIPQLGLEVICCAAESICNTEDTFTVHPEGQLILRSRCSGDEMRLPSGTKSLKKAFIDRKIPANQRQNVPVLADDAGVLGVYGIGVNGHRMAKSLPAVQLSIRNK